MFQDYFTALITAIATLAAAFIAFLLNERKNQKNKNEQIKSVKTLISIEIDKNLEMLSELWENINPDENSNKVYLFESGYKSGILSVYDNNEKKVIIADRLIKSRLPIWMNDAWKSQYYFLPIAFNEGDIKIINDFYNGLYTINSIYDSILAIRKKEDNEDQSIIENGHVDGVDSSTYNSLFYYEARFDGDKFEKIVRKLLKNGNPLNDSSF